MDVGIKCGRIRIRRHIEHQVPWKKSLTISPSLITFIPERKSWVGRVLSPGSQGFTAGISENFRTAFVLQDVSFRRAPRCCTSASPHNLRQVPQPYDRGWPNTCVATRLVRPCVYRSAVYWRIDWVWNFVGLALESAAHSGPARTFCQTGWLRTRSSRFMSCQIRGASSIRSSEPCRCP
jgi:hypothetical protein